MESSWQGKGKKMVSWSNNTDVLGLVLYYVEKMNKGMGTKTLD